MLDVNRNTPPYTMKRGGALEMDRLFYIKNLFAPMQHYNKLTMNNNCNLKAHH